jgi:hypothetical protein
MAESPGNRIASAIARLSPKQRQVLILGLGGSVFAVLIFGGVALWDQPTTLPEGTPPVRPQPLPISAPGRPGRPPRHLDEQVQRADAPDGGDDPGATPAGRPDRAEASCPESGFARHCRRSAVLATTTGDRAPQPATTASAAPATGESGRRDELGRTAGVTQATGDCHLRSERRQGQPTRGGRAGCRPERRPQLRAIGLVLPGGIARWSRRTHRRAGAKQPAPGPHARSGQRLPAEPLPLQDQGMLCAGRQLWRHQRRARLHPTRIPVLCAPRRQGDRCPGQGLRRR